MKINQVYDNKRKQVKSNETREAIYFIALCGLGTILYILLGI